MSMAQVWGATPAERALAYPCDGLVPGADALYRAIDVDAPPPAVFRWLCQLRAAPYSYDWIDNLGRQSPRTLTPGLEDLAVGQRVMRIFELVAFERDRHLTLRLTRDGAVFGAVALTYLVVPRGSERARLLVKILWRWPAAFGLGPVLRCLLPWGDFVMMRRQLLTLKALAEGR
jgi:hypothetical protein